MTLTIAYPIPSRKSLEVRDTFCCHTVGCRPGAQAYAYHWVKCGGIWRYRHGGDDLHGSVGDHLSAAYWGKVIWVYEGRSFGQHQFTIVDKFGRGFCYKHTESRPANGSMVLWGQKDIAKLGWEGLPSPDEAHLHFEIRTRWNDKDTVINPITYVRAAQAA